MNAAAWRREGFFDGLHGRNRPLPDRFQPPELDAYHEGYERGRAVWHRPRRPNPSREALSTILATEREAERQQAEAPSLYGGEHNDKGEPR